MLVLTTGPSAELRASFTRFVLPFNYQLHVPTAPTNAAWSWREDRVEDPYRLHYLTAETGAVLFRRARWWQLVPANADRREEPFAVFTLWNGDHQLPVHMGTPRLVLFEPKSRSESDLLRVGFLLLDVGFPAGTAAQFDDLLRLNEAFSYWRQPFVGHDDAPPLGYRDVIGQSARDAILSRLGVDWTGLADLYTDRWRALLDCPVASPEGLRGLIPANLQQQTNHWFADPAQWQTGWVASGEPRAYLWTAAVLPEGSQALHPQEPEIQRLWVQLVNGGKPGRQHPATEYEVEWAAQRTYVRWKHEGTLFGFSLHGGALLTHPPAGIEVVKHFATHYFDQTLLLLYLRFSAFSFSRRLAECAARARDAGDDALRSDDLRAIRRSFTDLANLYQYPLLSNQQQGIELYCLARKVLDIEDLFGEVGRQIAATHEAQMLEENTAQAQSSTRLTVVATVSLVFALATGFLSMEIITRDLIRRLPNESAGWDWLIFFIALAFAAVLLTFAVRHSVRLDRCLDRVARRRRRPR